MVPNFPKVCCFVSVLYGNSFNSSILLSNLGDIDISIYRVMLNMLNVTVARVSECGKYSTYKVE